MHPFQTGLLLQWQFYIAISVIVVKDNEMCNELAAVVTETVEHWSLPGYVIGCATENTGFCFTAWLTCLHRRDDEAMQKICVISCLHNALLAPPRKTPKVGVPSPGGKDAGHCTASLLLHVWQQVAILKWPLSCSRWGRTFYSEVTNPLGRGWTRKAEAELGPIITSASAGMQGQPCRNEANASTPHFLLFPPQ